MRHELSNKIKLVNRSLKKTKNILFLDQINTVTHDAAYVKSPKQVQKL